MKTIKDLVDRLNSYVAYGEFYIRKGKNDNYLLRKRYIEGEDATLFEFGKKQPYWSIHQPLGAMHNQAQKDIMDFVYSTDSKNWFDEEIIEVDGIKLTRKQAEKVYQKLTSERLYDIK